MSKNCNPSRQHKAMPTVLIACPWYPAAAALGAARVELITPAHLSRPMTLHILGPEINVTDATNPFREYCVDISFRQDELNITVPAYFAATRDAENSSADGGRLRKAHFILERIGA